MIAIFLSLSLAALSCLADSAIAPKFLWSASEPEAAKVSCDKGVSWKAEGGKFALDFEAGQGE